MRRLLRANISRLWKDRIFRIGLLAMVVYGFFTCISMYHNHVEYDMDVQFETAFFYSYVPICIVIAAFCSLFVGTEYSDGTIRNKLVVGLGRGEIYFSNFLTCTLACFLMNLSFMVVVSVIGIPLFGFFQMNLLMILAYVGTGFMAIAASVGIFTMMAMLIQNKALSGVLCLLVVFAMLFTAIFMFSRLGEPEYYEGFSQTVDGVLTSESVKNPMYPTDNQRAFYEFVSDFLPAGQSIQVSSLGALHLWRLPLYATGIVVVSNIAGILLFRRKDLK